MIKRLAVLVAVLAMVAAACSGSSEDTTTTTAAPDASTTTQAPSGGQAGGTLAEVIARGTLRCGVSTNAIGFAEPQDDGSFNGFDADYCRALAAAVFGDATKVEFVGTTAGEP
jgi:general L-amino acid transport system substrate-binding protein